MDILKSFEATAKGALGESISGAILYHLCIKGYKGYPFHNLYIPKSNGDYSEVDLAYATTKGIFVFECKNYSGWIFGSEKDQYWTASLANGQKNRFYNPVLQNNSHIRQIRNIVGKDVPCFSIIVFSDRCELKKITVNEAQVKVVKQGDLFEIIEKLWPHTLDVLSEDRVASIADTLKRHTHVDNSVKQAHIKAIQQKKQAHDDSEKRAKSTDEKRQNTMDIMDLVSTSIRKY